MKTLYSIVLFAVMFATQALVAQDTVVINEIRSDGTVELKNVSAMTVDVSGYVFCQFPSYAPLASLNLDCGSLMMPAGSILALSGFGLDPLDGELGLYINGTDFQEPDFMIDYLEWGASGHTRASVAESAGIWTGGDFVPAFGSGTSIEYAGAGNSSASWVGQMTPTICSENGGGGCDQEGGIISGGPYTICIDTVADFLTDVVLSNNVSADSLWLVSNSSDIILQTNAELGMIDFNVYAEGEYLLWLVSFDGTAMGIGPGMDITAMTGCVDLSNSITVTVEQCVSCDVDGGIVATQQFTFCVDTVPDFVMGVEVLAAVGDSAQWVVTDDNGVILGLPGSPDAVDFNSAGVGTCLIWHLSYDSTLTGLIEGNNALTDLTGCYDFADDVVTVIRTDTGVVCAPSSIGEDFLQSAISIYPNPSSGEFNFENTSDQPVIISLLDAIGREVSGTEILAAGARRLFDATQLDEGIYFLRIQSEDLAVTRSLVKH